MNTALRLFLVFCLMNATPVAIMSQQLAQETVQATNNASFTYGQDDAYRHNMQSYYQNSACVLTGLTFLSASIPKLMMGGTVLATNIGAALFFGLIGGAVYCWNQAFELHDNPWVYSPIKGSITFFFGFACAEVVAFSLLSMLFPTTSLLFTTTVTGIALLVPVIVFGYAAYTLFKAAISYFRADRATSTQTISKKKRNKKRAVPEAIQA